MPDLTTKALTLKSQHPDWGYIKIAKEIGWDKDKVRRAIEHDQRKRSATESAVALIEPRTAAEFAERITSCWRKSVEAIIEVGRLLTNAKAQLDHGEFQSMLAEKLPFGARTAQRLMAIGQDARLNATPVSLLPNTWGTLYELTKLDDEAFNLARLNGVIRPDLERNEISGTIKKQKRNARERILGAVQLALPTTKFGVIVADPEWEFEPWSRETGMDRAAANHYPTSCLAVISSRDVPSISADDCILFLWATIPMLPHAFVVMDAWGFTYKSHYAWVKDKSGTGYWNRENHELLLIGTRGLRIPCPAPGDQFDSAQHFARMRHSEKPEWFLEMIEGWYPTLPKIELNRRGPARPGWASWGNEAEAAA